MFVTETVRTLSYGFRRRHHPTFWLPSLFFVSSICLWFPSWQGTSFIGFRRWFLFMASVVAGKRFVYGFRRWTFGGFCRRRRIHNSRMYRAILRFYLCVFRTGFRRCFCFMVSVVAGTHCSFYMVSVCYRTAAVSPMETINNHQEVSVTN